MTHRKGIGGLAPAFLKRAVTRTLQGCGYQLINLRKTEWRDGLWSAHQRRFLADPKFQAAWRRGQQAGEGVDPGFEWRIHLGLWAASVAARAPGDFVECGVNAGFLSSAILAYLDWPRMGATFYLVDTFAGPPVEQYSADEIERGRLAAATKSLAAGAYVTDLERVRRNYQEWERIEIVQGRVPEILPAVKTDAIAFLHLDMNCAYPEVEALRYFWPQIGRGGVVLLDDYAYAGYEAQGNAMDAVARELDTSIAVLPTGQGLIVK